MPATLAETLSETLSFIERALMRIENGESAEAEAHNIRAYLVNTLELVERDRGIEAAADDLYAVAAAFLGGAPTCRAWSRTTRPTRSARSVPPA